MKSFSFQGKVWKYGGVGGWHFVYVEKKISEKIKAIGVKKVGFGFIKIRATLGKTSWNTTLFPTKEGVYLIAVKAVVRKKESVQEGDNVKIAFTIT